MIPLANKSGSSWAIKPRSSAETFWASYSDLMAGLLMIFALTTVLTLLDINKRQEAENERLNEKTQVVKKWKEIVKDLRKAQELEKIQNVTVDPETGALVIKESKINFGFNKTKLSEDAKDTLRRAVPKYLDIIYDKHPSFLEQIHKIEISGHTDRKDSNNKNPEISRERAGNVLEFLLKEQEMKRYRDLLKRKAVTAGYADTDFQKFNCAEDMCPEARRVEISIRLNEKKILENLLDAIGLDLN